jgi:hypothetical protein
MAVSFIWLVFVRKCSLSSDSVTFGHWPQVSDSVWLIATTRMAHTPTNPSAKPPLD